MLNEITYIKTFNY